MTELRIGEASAEVRASLRPIEWIVLEELALAAGTDEAGVLVAPTSARVVAERLGITAGAVARALASLRAVGLVSHVRRCGPSGRFGPSSYVLGSIPGLEVVDLGPAPCGDPPCSGAPCVGSPHMAAPSTGDQPADTGGVGGRRARRGAASAVEARPTMASGPQAPAQQRPAAKSTRRSGEGQPHRTATAQQLELLSAPPLKPAARRSQEHGR